MGRELIKRENTDPVKKMREVWQVEVEPAGEGRTEIFDQAIDGMVRRLTERYGISIVSDKDVRMKSPNPNSEYFYLPKEEHARRLRNELLDENDSYGRDIFRGIWIRPFKAS